MDLFKQTSVKWILNNMHSFSLYHYFLIFLVLDWTSEPSVYRQQQKFFIIFLFYPRLKVMLCWIFHVCKGIRRQSQHLSRGVANLGAIGSLWHHKRLLFLRCALHFEWRMDKSRFLAEFAERHLVKGFFFLTFFVKTQDSMISVLRALQLSQDFH